VIISINVNADAARMGAGGTPRNLGRRPRCDVPV
jgi:hypothetical protein